MHPPRYFLAKYVPDLRRMEPVNIGVVLWCNGRVASRFLTPTVAARFVSELSTYRRWLTFWEKLLEQPSIRIGREPPVDVGQPEYLDEFARSQNGNYLLAFGGEIIDTVRKSQLPDAVDYLFDELVRPARTRKTTPPASKRRRGK